MDYTAAVGSAVSNNKTLNYVVNPFSIIQYISCVERKLVIGSDVHQTINLSASDVARLTV